MHDGGQEGKKSIRMDGWMRGRMDGPMDGWKGKREGRIERWMNVGSHEGWTDQSMDQWLSERTNVLEEAGRADRWIHRWVFHSDRGVIVV